MTIRIPTLLMLVLAITSIHCSFTQHSAFKSREVYTSDDLVVIQIAENSFQHISFLQTNDFGRVPCNGLIVRNNNEAIIFDTPANDKSSEELLGWINNDLQCKVNAIIPTHFHNDCLGGLNVFEEHQIPSYANVKTLELAKEHHFVVPKNSFSDSLVLPVGKETVTVKFFGEGHTKDNVVGYFPADKVLFGGCLLKELGATKGYLGDANIVSWSRTVERVKAEYPDVNIVVPGHGKCGNKKLLDYTITLFKNP